MVSRKALRTTTIKLIACDEADELFREHSIHTQRVTALMRNIPATAHFIACASYAPRDLRNALDTLRGRSVPCVFVARNALLHSSLTHKYMHVFEDDAKRDVLERILFL